MENEELYYANDNTDSSGFNSDNDINDSAEDLETLELEGDAETGADVSAGTVAAFDYTYQETTNQYLFCIVVLLIVFTVTYLFNFVRHCFERNNL